ncbi:hypothetical protein EAPG_00965 [Escherichia albertii B156]|nr:hypothetical protein EAPG_00965 [Escherichia albertii B156]
MPTEVATQEAQSKLQGFTVKFGRAVFRVFC